MSDTPRLHPTAEQLAGVIQTAANLLEALDRGGLVDGQGVGTASEAAVRERRYLAWYVFQQFERTLNPGRKPLGTVAVCTAGWPDCLRDALWDLHDVRENVIRLWRLEVLLTTTEDHIRIERPWDGPPAIPLALRERLSHALAMLRQVAAVVRAHDQTGEEPAAARPPDLSRLAPGIDPAPPVEMPPADCTPLYDQARALLEALQQWIEWLEAHRQAPALAIEWSICEGYLARASAAALACEASLTRAGLGPENTGRPVQGDAARHAARLREWLCQMRGRDRADGWGGAGPAGGWCRRLISARPKPQACAVQSLELIVRDLGATAAQAPIAGAASPAAPPTARLTPRQRRILRAMLENHATSPRDAMNREAIVQALGEPWHPANWKDEFSGLKQLGLTDKRTGSRGGVWLTPSGIERAGQLPSPNNGH
jgi:hypothetical protein